MCALGGRKEGRHKAEVVARGASAIDESPFKRLVVLEGGRPVAMEEDSGGAYSIIRLDQTAGLVIAGRGTDEDLRVLDERGVVGADGSTLEGPMGSVQLEFYDLGSQKSVRAKFFVVDSENIPPFVLGRNVLRLISEGESPRETMVEG